MSRALAVVTWVEAHVQLPHPGPLLRLLTTALHLFEFTYYLVDLPDQPSKAFMIDFRHRYPP